MSRNMRPNRCSKRETNQIKYRTLLHRCMRREIVELVDRAVDTKEMEPIHRKNTKLV